MITEIEIAEKLSEVLESSIKENIINSGRVQGINIYKENLNILIAKKNSEKEKEVSAIKEKIKDCLAKDFDKITIDIQESEFKK